MKINPTLRLRAVIDLIFLLTHLLPKEKVKKTAVPARHFLIWDTGSTSNLLDDHHRFFLLVEPVIGADMIIWKNDSLYTSREGQELPLERLRNVLPVELVGDLMLILSAKQGKETGQVFQTTIDSEIPTERDPKIIHFPHAA